jgi:ectoine hydroxylase-related dioxygenase (phytanoyl-CoA dioxygenase family)
MASVLSDPGYAIQPPVLEHAEMTRVLDALANAPLARTRAGVRHVLAVPAVRRLAIDARLIAIAARLVGPSPIPFRATLFDKTPEANWLVPWHQDTALPLRSRIDDAEWGPWSIKAGVLYAHAPAWALETVVALRVHLDDSTAVNGPLRVLPDTHRLGVLTDGEIERLAHDVTPVECLAAAGGVVAMRPLTVHASSKSVNANPRRVLHIEYAAGLHLARGIELFSETSA